MLVKNLIYLLTVFEESTQIIINQQKPTFQKIFEKLVKVLPNAVQNVKDLVKEMKDIPKDDIKRRELSYRASKDVLKATNVFPSPQYAHNIYNDNRQQQNIQISQTIASLVGEAAIKQLEKLSEEEVDQ